mmetsp:Transcript_6275/g.12393  ORF Transcript_6275/g.12393 Transcript_6275/m.12393 type:complete len:137 (+) Transcript_6275:144-554(+)
MQKAPLFVLVAIVVSLVHPAASTAALPLESNVPLGRFGSASTILHRQRMEGVRGGGPFSTDVLKLDTLRLTGGQAAKENDSIIRPQTARWIRIVAIGLQVWGWLHCHTSSVTVVTPPLPIAGKYTFAVPLPKVDGS